MKMSQATSQHSQEAREAKLRVSQKAELPQREARVSKDILQRLGVSEGQEVLAEASGRRAQVKARAGEIPADRIELHPEDMKNLGLAEGSELTLKPTK
jgi:formylmethanofuran dehydrogenase subunit D